MLTLAYGLYQPETGDLGSTWFSALEDNFARLDAHDHDGTDSPLLSPFSVSRPSSTIAAADWTNDGNGSYSKVVTVPAAISGAPSQADNKFYALVILDANKDRIHPTVEWETATTFTVRVNDNTLDLTIYYV